MNCVKCNKSHNDYHFRVLQVQTLHVRDLNGEKRVQALGGFEEYDVCADCARTKYNNYLDNRNVLIKTSLPFVLMMVAGMIVAWLFRGDTPIFLFGMGLLICGVTCLYGNLHNRGAKKRELSALTEQEAMYRCAWECMIEGAPKKNDINDITYIPVNEETLARKNGDLMILYDLLPEIAIEAHKRLHETEV